MKPYWFKAHLGAIIAITVLLTTLSMGWPIYAEEITDEVAYDELANPYVAGQLIIGYAKITPADTRRSLRAQMQMELKSELKDINAEVVKVPNNRAKEIMDSLKRNPSITFAEYDYITSIDYVPNDPNYTSQVYLPYMKVNGAWDITKGSSNVLIAVLDTGVNQTNTDMKGLNLTGYNVLDNTTNFADDHGHGTMVMSVIAAKTNNAFGIAGVAPDSKFLAVKVMSSSGTGTYSSMIKGIEYAISQNAKVISMSIGGRTASSALKLAVDNAISKGATIVAAAGNESSTSLSYPAAYDNVIGVGAVDINGSKMSFSNTGSGITIVAGGSARVATSTDYISSASGTSFATPYISGTIGLLYAVDPTMNASKAITILAQTAKDLGSPGYDTSFGHGLVDIENSVRAASGGIVISPLPLDLTPPVLTLLGSTSIRLTKGSAYVEPGFTAVDNIDGNISAQVTIVGNVNINLTGLYELTYSVKDKAGNISNIEKRFIEIYETATEVSTELATESNTVDLGPDTKWVRDVEIVQGTLNKKTSLVTHVLKVITPGTLDIVFTYNGKSAPVATISELNFNGKAGSFTVEPASYILTISSTSASNTSYVATITYPEREVPIDVPLGDSEVIIYGESSNLIWYIYLGITLAIFAIALILYKKGKITVSK
jgi:subtilisin family serine protease